MAEDPYSSPLAYFRAELKRLRERAGMTQSDVAERTNYALSTVSAYETGTRIPSADFAKRADKVFGTDGDSEDDDGDLTRLQKLVEQVSVRPWFRDRIDVERKSVEIREYESYQIPGLLQTGDYARAIMSVGRPKISADEIERAVALRMTRQEILESRDSLPADQEQTPRYWAIIDESALRRIVGSPEIRISLSRSSPTRKVLRVLMAARLLSSWHKTTLRWSTLKIRTALTMSVIGTT